MLLRWGFDSQSEKCALFEPLAFHPSKPTRSVYGGFWHVYVISDDGCVSILGDADLLTSPISPILPRVSLASISCGREHVLAITFEHDAYGWGSNRHGQVGRDVCDQILPSILPWCRERRGCVSKVAAGEVHSLLITVSGTVFAFGRNQYGLCGQVEDSASPLCCTPRQVPFAFADEATVKSADDLSFEELPSPSNEQAVQERRVRIVAGSCGWSHNAVVDANGRVWTWGLGLYGALGHDSTDNLPVPRVVSSLYDAELKVLDVSCGIWHTAAVTEHGKVFTWGWNKDGQLGLPASTPMSSVPRLIQFTATASDTPGLARLSRLQPQIVRVVSGSRHCLALSSQGHLYGWGWNGFGQVLPGRDPSSETKSAITETNLHEQPSQLFSPVQLCPACQPSKESNDLCQRYTDIGCGTWSSLAIVAERSWT